MILDSIMGTIAGGVISLVGVYVVADAVVGYPPYDHPALGLICIVGTLIFVVGVCIIVASWM